MAGLHFLLILIVAFSASVVITLEEAIKRAEANEPLYAASLAESLAAGQERWVARKDLLPSVDYHNQALYTQTDRGQTIPRFIANNAIREYSSQAVVNETLGLGRPRGTRMQRRHGQRQSWR